MTEPESDFLAAARTFYDTVAEDYAASCVGVLESKPLDRAMLAAFAEFVQADVASGGDGDGDGDGDGAHQARGAGPVAEIGCGPGTITAILHSLGLDAFGLDLSARMVALARRKYPDLTFIEGSMTALPLGDGSMRGLVPWYSTIHIPEQQLPGVFAEFHRVLTPGGHLLLAFQAGDEPLHVTEAFGHQVTLDFRRRSPDRVAQLVTDAGFDMLSRMVREPTVNVERTQQAYLLARKPPVTSTSDR